MNIKELENEISETFNPIFRMTESDEIAFYQLLALLMNKGVINKDDFDEYLSSEAINKRIKEINDVLKKEGL